MSNTEDNIRSVAGGAISQRLMPLDSIQFYAIRLTPKLVARSSAVSNWEIFEGVILALAFSSGSTHSVLGSAVIVAPGVALSAYHTVRDCLPKIRTGETSVMAVGITSQGLLIWRLLSVVCVERTDLCIMRLGLITEIPPTRPCYMATLTTRLPEIGETLLASGFVASKQAFQQSTPTAIELAGGMRLTSGPVTQIFPKGRDKLLVPWPGLEVDAPLFGGMSGGAIFDRHGALIGLGSRSMDLGIEEEPSPMVVALLWPVLGQRFAKGEDPAGPSTSLLEMNAQGAALIERPEAVSVSTENGGVIITTHESWT